MVGHRASNTAYLTYLLYCDKIRIQILNCSQGCDFATKWNRVNNHGLGSGQFLHWIKPFVMDLVGF